MDRVMRLLGKLLKKPNHGDHNARMIALVRQLASLWISYDTVEVLSRID